MVVVTKVTTVSIKSMGRVPIHTQMEVNTVENGLTDSNTGLEVSLMQTVLSNVKESGQTES